ncbi:Fur-regulated basic protein FbpA [Bacillus coagulans]|uniref:Fur-regulated basic protein FbpA n=1 Tax=Heyndrickxia coagulans TaxID=1398 RepID=UPI0013783E04|nr:Fur-regulated basic protein FbpA [Heyndrickxia coagulans]
MAFNEIEQRKDELKEKLLKMGYFKHPDGRQLYELSLSELEKAYKTIKRGDVFEQQSNFGG